ncbi:radical SAM domain iron-sulfur cluster-binding oxidoreductase [Syntrophotalea carbinolica DSM 2380]|uniref:Radical SAM domain iron-sulfur cluster-binding oxidoreductase n=1 Tax=Syntrophotalea carbinolica (strain DSM 2380 / NBRC 103641 / GraBd1) TaxID=338963 RepID=Q3A4Q7_SYNC1|nr:radical SAM protein [Syntrophotalea carbinolica]ABA88650.1 radical SAM domain iron-sulfur cluster-binding oxidoreductase [Syntrophotalea carbinolica DSM 2380]
MTVYPFFIPHQGCKHRCVFCEQHRISGVVSAPAPAQVSQQLDSMLPLCGDGEVAFYGGSFTLLDASLQLEYLRCVSPYIAAGRVSGVRISTRPDACGFDVVARLAALGVTTVELGCQSFSARVLEKAARGHGPQAARDAVGLLRDAGIRIGLQLMPGLPGGSLEEARYSLACALDLRPDFLRIYPTVVIAGTDLEILWRQGEYIPWTLEEAVELCAELMWHCHRVGMPVIRIGLQASVELDTGDAVVAGPYHPAFGQLVRSRIWRRALESVASQTGERQVDVAFADLSDALGHRRSNIDYLKRRFGSFEIVAKGAPARQNFVVKGHNYDMMSKACYLQPLSITVG